MVNQSIISMLSYGKINLMTWIKPNFKCRKEAKFVNRYSFYYFGIEHALISLNGNPEWHALRSTPRNELGGWWASKEQHDLNGRLGGLLQNVKNGLYDIGFDAAPPFDKEVRLCIIIHFIWFNIHIIYTKKYHCYNAQITWMIPNLTKRIIHLGLSSFDR